MIDAALKHGWSGIAVAYTAVQAPMIAGLMRARARLSHYVMSPTVAVPLTVIAALGAGAAHAWLARWGLGGSGAAQLAIGTGISALIGYSGGKVMGRDAAAEPVHQRGSVVTNRPRVSHVTARGLRQEAGISLAGMIVPSKDETKHFKLIGTTGTGKSTAIQEILSSALRRGDRAVIADPDAGYLKEGLKNWV